MIDPTRSRPVLYGIGVGPGDPELLTLKALRILTSVDRLAYPANAEGQSLAYSIVSPHLAGRSCSEQDRDIVLPMRFVPGVGPEHPAYDDGAAAIRDHLRQGLSVAFLCEGDPLFYGSFIQVLSRMRSPVGPDDYGIEIVPGITAMSACASLTQTPLVTWEEGLTVLPATLPDSLLKERLAITESAVIMKLGRHLPRVLHCLAETGMAETVSVVVRAGLPGQKVLDPATALREGVPYFSLLIARRTRVLPFGALQP